MPTGDTRAYFEPVRKSVKVNRSVAEVFELFTAGIERWWPLAQYSISLERAVRCVLEGKVGGAIYEVRDDEATFPWGRVLVWQPPSRLVLSWHPGRPESSAQEVEVRFSPVGGGTLVELEHRGWAKLGDEAAASRESYDAGWETVLHVHFAHAASP